MKINISFDISKKSLVISILYFVGFVLLLWQVGFFAWLGAKEIFGISVEEQKFISDISRNRGWLVWGSATFIVAIVGMGLTAWGRTITQKQTQQEKEQIELNRKSNIHERYQKAANMLGSEIMPVRIAGCHAIRELAIDDKNMWSPCIGLLFGYIKFPFLSVEKKEHIRKAIKTSALKEDADEPIYEYEAVDDLIYADDALIEIFPLDKPLRADIQEAINSIFAIYEHIHESQDSFDKVIQLPSYFWQNEEKEKVCISGVNVGGEDLQKAKLSQFDLEKTNFSGSMLQAANLSQSILKGAIFNKAQLYAVNLDGANITGASFLEAKNLTKEQILSATWDIGCKPPELDDELMEDKDIKKWLKDPSYNFGVKVENKKLSEVIPIDNQGEYKVHCAVISGDGNSEQPLKVFSDGRWADWQKPWGELNRFNRDYIFTIMRCYDEPAENTWIFGGIYEVVNRRGMNDYDVVLTNEGEKYIGKLKIKLILNGRSRYRRLESIYDDMEVVEVLDEPYSE